jgi:hypothetical protein
VSHAGVPASGSEVAASREPPSPPPDGLDSVGPESAEPGPPRIVPPQDARARKTKIEKILFIPSLVPAASRERKRAYSDSALFVSPSRRSSALFPSTVRLRGPLCRRKLARSRSLRQRLSRRARNFLPQREFLPPRRSLHLARAPDSCLRGLERGLLLRRRGDRKSLDVPPRQALTRLRSSRSRKVSGLARPSPSARLRATTVGRRSLTGRVP